MRNFHDENDSCDPIHIGHSGIGSSVLLQQGLGRPCPSTAYFITNQPRHNPVWLTGLKTTNFITKTKQTQDMNFSSSSSSVLVHKYGRF